MSDDLTKSFIYHEGFYDGWTEGREAMASSLMDSLYVLEELYTDAYDLSTGIARSIEDEVSAPAPNEEGEQDD